MVFESSFPIYVERIIDPVIFSATTLSVVPTGGSVFNVFSLSSPDAVNSDVVRSESLICWIKDEGVKKNNVSHITHSYIPLGNSSVEGELIFQLEPDTSFSVYKSIEYDHKKNNLLL